MIGDVRPGEGLYAVGDDGCVSWLFGSVMDSPLWDFIWRDAAAAVAWLLLWWHLIFDYAEPVGLRLGWISAPIDWRPYTGLPCPDLRAHPSNGPPAAAAASELPVICP